MQTLCWVISSGAAGMENQAVSLANTLGFSKTKHTLSIKRIRLRPLWRFIAPYIRFAKRHSYTPKLSPPWPQLVIASGSQAILPALHIKKVSKGETKVIYLQNPRINPSLFDAVVCPHHDQLKGDNVFSMIGTPVLANEEQTKKSLDFYQAELQKLPFPRIAIMIGGPNRSYKMDIAWVQKMCAQLKNFHNNGMGIMITSSRRTPDDIKDYLHKNLSRLNGVFFWDGTNENPYPAFLKEADMLLVTSESVSMVSEACSTDKPVYLIKLQGSNKRFDYFHQSLIEAERVRWLSNHELPKLFNVMPLNETQKVASKLKEKLDL